MNRALILLCLLTCLTACANERIVERPVPVEIPVTEFIPVPQELTRPIEKAIIPNSLNFGDALVLWAQDRATIEALNSRLAEIGELDGD